MNRSQYDSVLAAFPVGPSLSLQELSNQSDRTLLWGYNIDRESHHVFLKGGLFHVFVYSGVGRVTNARKLQWEDVRQTIDVKRLTVKNVLDLERDGVVPNKRLYPEACDYEMCLLLRLKGVNLPFTTFNDKREPETFYGLLPRGL